MATDIRLKEALPALVDQIVGTYEECGTLHHLGHSPLPSYREVVEILIDLREVLYPGYGRRQDLNMGNVTFHVGDVIHSLNVRLSEQIGRAYRHDCKKAAEPENDFEGDAQVATLRFLECLPEIRDVLRDDVRAAYDGDPAASGMAEILFCYPGLTAITFYRLAHEMWKLHVPLIPRMMTEYAHSKTGIDIHPGATIGPRFFIDHGTGVVIGETTEIGRNVKIYQGVTLGALSFHRDETTGELVRGNKRHPTIEDDVVIYANATILGGRTTIGHHAVIGSSAWITRTVAPFTTVTIEDPRLRIRGAEPNGNGLDYQI